MYHNIYSKKAVLFFFCGMVLHAASGQQTIPFTEAQQGPLTLEENFKLAKKYPTPSGWLLANACSGCHGTDGAEMDTEIPPIVGLDKKTFIHMMKAYQTEKPSKATVMTIVAEPLTDKEIEAMAEYFSKQKVQEWTQPGWHKDVKAPAWVKQYEKNGKGKRNEKSK